MITWCKITILSLTVIILFGGLTIRASEPIRQGDFTYYFDNPRYIPAADSALQVVRDRLEELLYRDFTFSVEVYLLDSPEAFDSLIGGGFPDWGAAAAIPSLNRIVIRSPEKISLNRSLRELLSHEYAHLALAQRTGPYTPPRWLDEGFAMMVSTEWSWDKSLSLNMASITGDFVSLREIDQVNRFGQGKANLAYAESYLAVQYLYTTYGNGAVNRLLDEISRGSTIDRSLMVAIESNYADFEREFHVYLKGRFNFIGLVADTKYFWLSLVVVMVVGFILNVRRRKKYYRKWDDEEKYASTDFDYGDPEHPEQIDDDEPWRQ